MLILLTLYLYVWVTSDCWNCRFFALGVVTLSSYFPLPIYFLEIMTKTHCQRKFRSCLDAQKATPVTRNSFSLSHQHTHTHRVSVLLIHSLNGNGLYFLAALRGTKWRVWTPAVSQHTVSKSSEPFQKTNCISEVMFRDVCHPAPPVIVSMEESGARWARIIRWHCTFLQTADMLNVTDHMNRININM